MTGDAAGPEPEPEPEPNATYYQFDFVAGDVITRFGPPDGDRFYNDQSRLIEYSRASITDGHYRMDRTGGPSKLADDVDRCVVVRSYSGVSAGGVTAQFTVAEGCELDLTLAVYEKPGSGWSRANASEQRLVDVDAGTFGPGTHELRVSLTSNATETVSRNDARSTGRSS